jgi:hypothetical protein
MGVERQAVDQRENGRAVQDGVEVSGDCVVGFEDAGGYDKFDGQELLLEVKSDETKETNGDRMTMCQDDQGYCTPTHEIPIMKPVVEPMKIREPIGSMRLSLSTREVRRTVRLMERGTITQRQ